MIENERLELRIDRDVKEILQHAADILHMTLTEFVVNSSTVKAIEFTKNHNHVLDIIKQRAIIINELRKSQ